MGEVFSLNKFQSYRPKGKCYNLEKVLQKKVEFWIWSKSIANKMFFNIFFMKSCWLCIDWHLHCLLPLNAQHYKASQLHNKSDY